MGFRLNLKWVLPTHSHFHISSPSRLSSSSSSSSARGRDASLNQAKSSFLSVVSEEGEVLCKERFSSYASLQTLENDYSEMEQIKMNIGKNGLDNMIDDTKMPVGSLRKRKTSHFSLLLENLNVLEETFSDSDALRLERDILMHLGRLGALKLFNTCLSRTLETSSLFDLSHVRTEHIGEPIDRVDKIVVHFGKKEERKSTRERALENAARISCVSLPSKTIQKFDRQPGVSSAKKASNSRSRRLMIARNEAEMSRGVKVVANLERIRTILEEETGRVVSLSCWAEAAGVNEKLLNQQLRFGWYCRDELLRSTRSLVLYLARNYRGLGIPLEDLLQIITKYHIEDEKPPALALCIAVIDDCMKLPKIGNKNKQKVTSQDAGNMGVLQGAERFDHTRGYRFSTYVQYWIRKSMSRIVTQHGSEIRIPYTLSRAVNQIQKARKSLNNSHGKYPDDNKIAKFTGLSLAKIRSASKCQRVVGSIDQKMGNFFKGKYMEFMADMSIKCPEEIVMRQHMKKDIHTLLKGLDSKERQVLVLRYGLMDYQPKSLEEIGRLFNVSKEWVRRIQKKAMTKLKDKVTQTNLSHYLNF